MRKHYVIDTNVLLDDINCIEVLRNGSENSVIIPYEVLIELDKLKNDVKLRFLVMSAVEKIKYHLEKNEVTILKDENIKYETGDLKILNNAIKYKEANNIEPFTIISNDRIFQLLCNIENIKSENFNKKREILADVERFTGLIKTKEDAANFEVANYFMWDSGKLNFYNDGKPELVDTDLSVWKIKPKFWTQSAAYHLLLHNDINMVSIAGNPGMGKTYLSLAVALQGLLEKKIYEKIYFIKNTNVVGQELGFLPGDVFDKTEVYNTYAADLIRKLHNIRPANKLFLDENKKKINSELFEFLPIQFLRGKNLENCMVIIDECQNLTRHEIKTILTRIGNGKVVILGDPNQIDANLNKFTCGLNSVFYNLKSHKNFAHLLLNGPCVRGKICDMVLSSNL